MTEMQHDETPLSESEKFNVSLFAFFFFLQHDVSAGRIVLPSPLDSAFKALEKQFKATLAK